MGESKHGGLRLQPESSDAELRCSDTAEVDYILNEEKVPISCFQSFIASLSGLNDHSTLQNQTL